MPEQEPPLEIWRISAQGLLPSPNGVYSGCNAAGRGGEGLSRSGGDDASTKKAPPPRTHIAMSNGNTNTHPLPHSRRLELALGHLYDPIWKGTAAIAVFRGGTLPSTTKNHPLLISAGTEGEGRKVCGFFEGGPTEHPWGVPTDV